MNQSTPRQRRLQAEREQRMTNIQEAVRMILGSFLLAAIFVVFVLI